MFINNIYAIIISHSVPKHHQMHINCQVYLNWIKFITSNLISIHKPYVDIICPLKWVQFRLLYFVFLHHPLHLHYSACCTSCVCVLVNLGCLLPCPELRFQGEKLAPVLSVCTQPTSTHPQLRPTIRIFEPFSKLAFRFAKKIKLWSCIGVDRAGVIIH